MSLRIGLRLIGPGFAIGSPAAAATHAITCTDHARGRLIRVDRVDAARAPGKVPACCSDHKGHRRARRMGSAGAWLAARQA